MLARGYETAVIIMVSEDRRAAPSPPPLLRRPPYSSTPPATGGPKGRHHSQVAYSKLRPLMWSPAVRPSQNSDKNSSGSAGRACRMRLQWRRWRQRKWQPKEWNTFTAQQNATRKKTCKRGSRQPCDSETPLYLSASWM